MPPPIKHNYRVQLVARFTMDRSAIGQIMAEQLALGMAEYWFASNFAIARGVMLEIVESEILLPEPTKGDRR